MNAVERYGLLKKKKEELDKEVLTKTSEYETLKNQYKEEAVKVLQEYNVKTIDELEKLAETEQNELTKKLDSLDSTLKVLDVTSPLGSGDLDL